MKSEQEIKKQIAVLESSMEIQLSNIRSGDYMSSRDVLGDLENTRREIATLKWVLREEPAYIPF